MLARPSRANPSWGRSHGSSGGGGGGGGYGPPGSPYGSGWRNGQYHRGQRGHGGRGGSNSGGGGRSGAGQQKENVPRPNQAGQEAEVSRGASACGLWPCATPVGCYGIGNALQTFLPHNTVQKWRRAPPPSGRGLTLLRRAAVCAAAHHGDGPLCPVPPPHGSGPDSLFGRRHFRRRLGPRGPAVSPKYARWGSSAGSFRPVGPRAPNRSIASRPPTTGCRSRPPARATSARSSTTVTRRPQTRSGQTPSRSRGKGRTTGSSPPSAWSWQRCRSCALPVRRARLSAPRLHGLRGGISVLRSGPGARDRLAWGT